MYKYLILLYYIQLYIYVYSITRSHRYTADIVTCKCGDNLYKCTMCLHFWMYADELNYSSYNNRILNY